MHSKGDIIRFVCNLYMVIYIKYIPWLNEREEQFKINSYIY